PYVPLPPSSGGNGRVRLPRGEPTDRASHLLGPPPQERCVHVAPVADEVDNACRRPEVVQGGQVAHIAGALLSDQYLALVPPVGIEETAHELGVRDGPARRKARDRLVGGDSQSREPLQAEELRKERRRDQPAGERRALCA